MVLTTRVRLLVPRSVTATTVVLSPSGYPSDSHTDINLTMCRCTPIMHRHPFLYINHLFSCFEKVCFYLSTDELCCILDDSLIATFMVVALVLSTYFRSPTPIYVRIQSCHGDVQAYPSRTRCDEVAVDSHPNVTGARFP